MTETTTLENTLLLAMPGMEDPNFEKTVVCLSYHEAEHGAMGVIVNRPAQDFTVEEMCQKLDMDIVDPLLDRQPVYAGGPVRPEHGCVLHTTEMGAWQSTLALNINFHLTMSRDILRAIAGGRGPQHFLVFLGYCGWAPGQLENELANNNWLTVPAAADILFNVPSEQRWSAAIAALGIDAQCLHSEAGHA